MTVHDLGFGEPQEVPDFGDDGSSDTPPRNVPTCDVCGTVLEYSGRGRPPTKCPEHKKTSSRTTDNDGRKKPSTKAEREAAELAEKFRKTWLKIGLGAGMVDPFDGFAVLSSTKTLTAQAQEILSHDNLLRARLSKVGSTSSVATFVATIIVCVGLPIAAHHGAVPGEIRGVKIAEAFEQLPKLLSRFEKMAEEASQRIEEEMLRREKEAKEKRDAEAQPRPMPPT